LAGVMSIAHPLSASPTSKSSRSGTSILKQLSAGVISGLLRGVVGGNCYFNDCGYDDDGYCGGGIAARIAT
jgi:hypothetical protein